MAGERIDSPPGNGFSGRGNHSSDHRHSKSCRDYGLSSLSFVEQGSESRCNGKKVAVKQKPGSYIAITRLWKDGDRITADYPMRLRVETTPDNPQRERWFMVR